jgi:hypothetical protein
MEPELHGGYNFTPEQERILDISQALVKCLLKEAIVIWDSEQPATGIGYV